MDWEHGMKRMILAKCLGAAMAVTVMAGFVGQASAGLRQYCDSYARDVANHETNGGADVLAGTVGGAVGGAIIGGLIGGNGRSAGTGAIIGGVGGTVLGAGVTSDRYKRAYNYAYNRCMDDNAGRRYQTYDDGGGRSWTRACARKYPSFNPQTGKYRTASGKWKPCRL
jgi:BA14K-like protein